MLSWCVNAAYAKMAADAADADKYQSQHHADVESGQQLRKLAIGKGGKKSVAIDETEINLKCVPPIDRSPVFDCQERSDTSEGSVVECSCC